MSILQKRLPWITRAPRPFRQSQLMEDDLSALEWASHLNKAKNPDSSVNKNNKWGQKRQTAEELSRLRVAHEDLGEMFPGEDQILVLDDIQVTGEGDEDRLVSLAKQDEEKTRKRLREQRKKRPYEAWGEEDESRLSKTSLGARATPNEDKADDRRQERGMTLAEIGRTSHREQDVISAEEPKVKRRNIRRRLVEFTDEPVPLPSSVPEQADEMLKPKDYTLLDDEDLQLTIAKSRRQNLRHMISKREDLHTVHEDMAEEEQIRGIVLSESTDFVNALPEARSAVATMDDTMSGIESANKETKERVNLEDVKERLDEAVEGPFEREPLVRRGVGATLKFLSKLGIKPQLFDENESFLDARQRFSDIKIEHYDQEGNLLTPKEAYKLLSHKFHGIKPGKGKQEKMRKKKEQARRMQSFALGDTPLGTASALRERQKTTGEAHIVLQHGNYAVEEKTKPTSAVALAQNNNKSVNVKKGKPVESKPRIFGMK